jgi:hypothetical protein
MSTSSKGLFLAAGVLLGVVLIIPWILATYGIKPAGPYRALSRVEIDPFQADVLQPAFRGRLVGRDSSIRLVQSRSTSLIQVIADARSPHEAAALANASATKLKAILKERPGISVHIVDLAELPLRQTPSLPLLTLIRSILGLTGALFFVLACFGRRQVGDGQYADS